VSLERIARPVAAVRLDRVARSLLRAAPLCAISTVSPGGRAHVNTAYFAWTDRFDIVWLSSPAARHSRNIDASGMAAIAVFDSRQTWGDADRGIQLFGTARELRGRAAEDADRLYERRFRDARDLDTDAYRYYRLSARRMKLFDERRFGGATFVTARVRRDGALEWVKTERYV
jgi:uncharacterized protein YhbP (UPF0306 family)